MVRWLAAAAVMCACVFVYGPGLGAPFVFDDTSALPDNPNLRRASTAFSPPADTALTGRPLVHASFALNYALGGVEPAGYRGLNLGLHLLNALLVWMLLRRIFTREQLPSWLRLRADATSTAIAVLWTLHPLQTEAVAYVVQRTELLVSTFLLGVLHSALSALEHPGERRPALYASLLCALGAGCKETIVAAPLLVLCCDRAFYSASFSAALKRHRLLYAGQLAGVLPLFAELLVRPRDLTAGFGLGVTALDSLALQGRAIAWYLRLSIWPRSLSVSYNWPIDHALGRYWRYDLAIAALFVLTLVLSLRRRPSALIGWFFFIALAPSSSVVPILSEMVAERRMYLPLLSVLCAAVLAVTHALSWLGSPRALRLLAIAVAGLASAYVVRARMRIDDYRSAEALFASALHAAPDNPQAMWGLGGAYEASGDVTRARDLYERMAAHPYPYIGPASWGTRGLLAEFALLSRLGDREAASAALQRALTHDPRSAIGRLQHAAELANHGQGPRARAEMESLLRQPYLHDRIHVELGALDLQTGDLARARQHFDQALRLTRDPTAVEARIASIAGSGRAQ